MKTKPALQELFDAADWARRRVSTMSPEERAELRKKADEIIRQGREQSYAKKKENV